MWLSTVERQFLDRLARARKNSLREEMGRNAPGIGIGEITALIDIESIMLVP
jgi:hypothetical protein